jgi:hypothetical protein
VTRNIDGSITATGDGVTAFQCLTLAAAIKLWRLHKIKANRMFKITDALLTASRLTKRGPYSKSQLIKAEEDLRWRANFIKMNLLEG